MCMLTSKAKKSTYKWNISQNISTTTVLFNPPESFSYAKNIIRYDLRFLNLATYIQTSVNYTPSTSIGF